MGDRRGGGGLDLRGVEDGNAAEALGGTGGSSGGGTLSGAGRPAGGALGGSQGEADAPAREPQATPRPDSLAGVADSEIAAEAGALGSADGALADAAGLAGHRRGGTPTMGEAIGAGAGRGEPGSGTPGDRGELGGGDPLNALAGG